MLPLIRLPECQNCGTHDQGTRAKGGNSVRCSGCGTMRRVPHDRRTWGEDDPRATRPQRGRPLRPGHPYRFRPGNRAGAPTRPEPAAPASTAEQPAAEPAPVMDTFREIVRRLQATPDAPLKFATDTGDGTDCMELVRLAAAIDEKRPEFGLFWEAAEDWKSVNFWIDRSEFEAESEPIPAPAPKRPVIAPKLNLSQPPRRLPNQVSPPVVTRPTYVNPDTCPHPELSYDHLADAYRCPDCHYARPAWG